MTTNWRPADKRGDYAFAQDYNVDTKLDWLREVVLALTEMLEVEYGFPVPRKARARTALAKLEIAAGVPRSPRLHSGYVEVDCPHCGKTLMIEEEEILRQLEEDPDAAERPARDWEE